MFKLQTLLLLILLLLALPLHAQHWQYVDPRIGSVGVGRTFPGPSAPFGMVKPGPDCGVLPNAGWAPMPEPVTGFSQTHVSGTGGGQKYGNILIMPYLGNASAPAVRLSETIALGYYSATFTDGIRTEITTSARCAHYRLHYPSASAAPSLLVDPTHFLGKSPTPNLRERQQFVASSLTPVSAHLLTGSSTVRGGWNNGDPYTVYFALYADQPFTTTIDTIDIAAAPAAPAAHRRTARLHFADTLVTLRIGISYVSTDQARRNLDTTTFDRQLQLLRADWEAHLARVDITTPDDAQRRMFYTALYHTMLMPVDKTGENPRWTAAPYYDDYYAIWDTYRTSTPLLTILEPQRQADIVRSLLNIYKNEGYMPDARSGDCNGRTQGGSNAEIVIADAFLKGLGRPMTAAPAVYPFTAPIDYPLALEAMVHDAEADPGPDHEKHGRGGLTLYNRLGYIPYGTPRAGTRTVEYAYCDYCLAQVAQALGRTDLYRRYLQRSGNWRNLWRADYEYDGMRGFIMPRDEQGQWLDSVTWGRSQVYHPRIPYTPVTKVAPWYLPWWDTFFYEATSQEYSLSIPHDVPGLIEACGGPDAFRQRLDRFFQRGYYNVQNEPSFLTPCLYHWIGRPDLSTARIHHICTTSYSDRPDGLPGNDDSGAMSSWLAFHMLGLYPNAGQDYYLLNLPLLPAATIHLPNGRTLTIDVDTVAATSAASSSVGRDIIAPPPSSPAPFSFSALLNGRPLPDYRLTHAALLEGGTLRFLYAPASPAPTAPTATQISFTLNRQFRTWPLVYSWQADTLRLRCKQTLYLIPRAVADSASNFCWLTPQTDGTVYRDVQGTFAFISFAARRQLLATGSFVYDGITWRLIDQTPDALHVRADIDLTEMWISTDPQLPLVLRMLNNPLGIDWTIP